MKTLIPLIQFVQSFTLIGVILRPFGSRATNQTIRPSSDIDFYCQVSKDSLSQFDNLIVSMKGKQIFSNYAFDEQHIVSYRFKIIHEGEALLIDICVVKDEDLKTKAWNIVKDWIRYVPKQYRSIIWNSCYK